MSKRAFDLGAELRKAGGPTVDTREQIEYIDLDRIDPDPENFYIPSGINELAGNIELVGLQQPLRVRDGERGHVIIVSGHRRRAAIMLIRDGGSDMFKNGVPCIREKPDSSKEMQELRLIFANSQTRVMTAPEMSRQAVRTRDLLARLRDQGMDFQGRTRELVASVLQTSDSRVGRLTAIREKLVPELLKYFDGDRLGETVAYRLSQEDRTTQLKLAIQLGPEVQNLSKDTVEKVIGQAKKPKEAEETDCHTSAAAQPSFECRAARQDARNDGDAEKERPAAKTGPSETRKKVDFEEVLASASAGAKMPPEKKKGFAPYGAIKAEIRDRFIALRAQGMTIAQTVNLSGGKVTEGKILTIMNGGKVGMDAYNAIEDAMNKWEQTVKAAGQADSTTE